MKLTDIIEHQDGMKSKVKKCLPRITSLIGFMGLATVGTFIGFSIYTIPDGSIGYVEGADDYISSGVYLHFPWSPKPTVISVQKSDINFEEYTASIINATIAIRNCQLKYAVDNINAYVERVKKYGNDYNFSLRVEAINDMNQMFIMMKPEKALRIVEKTFIDNVFVNATDVSLASVIFTSPQIVY